MRRLEKPLSEYSTDYLRGYGEAIQSILKSGDNMITTASIMKLSHIVRNVALEIYRRRSK